MNNGVIIKGMDANHTIAFPVYTCIVPALLSGLSFLAAVSLIAFIWCYELPSRQQEAVENGELNEHVDAFNPFNVLTFLAFVSGGFHFAVVAYYNFKSRESSIMETLHIFSLSVVESIYLSLSWVRSRDILTLQASHPIQVLLKVLTLSSPIIFTLPTLLELISTDTASPATTTASTLTNWLFYLLDATFLVFYIRFSIRFTRGESPNPTTHSLTIITKYSIVGSLCILAAAVTATFTSAFHTRNDLWFVAVTTQEVFAFLCGCVLCGMKVALVVWKRLDRMDSMR
ncbi:hypothetical protein BC830DRAFT_1158141, partial [Chytriomyces sp. MP71]